MNTKAIVAVVVVLLLLGGGAAVMLANQSQNEEVAMENGAPSESAADSGQDAKTLRALMSANARQQCTFSSEEEGVTSTGTVYFGNGNMRGDFESVVDGEVYDAQMIVDGNDVYVWQTGESQGFQTTLDATAELQGEAEQNIDFDEEVDYDCRSWSVDASMFDLPNDVDFMDVSAMMEGSANMNAQQCAACDQLGSAAEQCRMALGCE